MINIDIIAYNLGRQMYIDEMEPSQYDVQFTLGNIFNTIEGIEGMVSIYSGYRFERKEYGREDVSDEYIRSLITYYKGLTD